ncbi:hypothetical protein NE237_011874 [Protea cynaroides]|uniref:Jacalin-type lectin domain-containing protein n=1 Tax=Protea cynaroides TaxID=273540 RepID=A0A9Q0GY18_9MAGN|nr:hypothetical protein NE237_011874 [Protea cynaroides]
MTIKVGPAGGYNANKGWDDGSIGKVKQIFITYDDDYGVKSIQTVLEFPGGSVLMDKHGGQGRNFRTISLAENESIILVRGYYLTFYGGGLIKSLSIRTTLREYGPYGCDVVRGDDIYQFNFEVEADKLAGFYGSSDHFSLHAIGIYMHTEATITLEEMKKQGHAIDKMMVRPSVPRLTYLEA